MRRIVVLVMAAGIVAMVMIASVSIWFSEISYQEFQHSTYYDGAYRLPLDSYYNASNLPSPYPVKMSLDVNQSQFVNGTASYSLAPFTDIVQFNDSSGQFELGIFVQQFSNYNLSSAAAGSHISPVIMIALLKADYGRGVYLAFRPLSLSVYGGRSSSNLTDTFSPYLVRLWSSGSLVNTTSRTEVTPTLGTVYNVNPSINSSRTLVSRYLPGAYYIQMRLGMYRMTQAGITYEGGLNLTEPWFTLLP